MNGSDDRLDAHLDELERRFEAREPVLRAFVPEEGRFERLRREAAALLARYPEPALRPPLFGVPVGVKDIFRVDGFETRGGSALPPEALAGEQASSVSKLLDAGALVLGKTATTEFAYFAPGPTTNPHHPEHTPGGSSSGSAAAVGAGLCPLTLGTQTIGSIGRPAAFCGAVGWKPSFGRVATDGVIPLAPSLDHVGTFTPDIAGAARAAAVLIDDWREVAPIERPTLGVPAGDYLEAADEEGQRHFERCRARLDAAGYRVVPMIAFEDFAAVRARHDRLLAGEAARVHAEWYGRYRERYHPKTAELIERGQAVGDDELDELRAGCAGLLRELDGLMEEGGVDLWIAPGARGTAPAGLASTGDPVMSLPWTQSGMPTLTVPAGTGVRGLPLGLQLIGRFGADEYLLAWAAAVAAIAAPVPKRSAA